MRTVLADPGHVNEAALRRATGMRVLLYLPLAYTSKPRAGFSLLL
jgi:hypothetical protein